MRRGGQWGEKRVRGGAGSWRGGGELLLKEAVLGLLVLELQLELVLGGRKGEEGPLPQLQSL